jgi:hypothetical protein
MRKLVSSLIAAAGVAFALGAAPAAAAPVLWTIQNAAFNDGTTFGGSFTFDAPTFTYSDFDITTGDGSIPGFHYTSANSFANSDSPSSFYLFNNDFFFSPPGNGFHLAFDEPLGDAGGIRSFSMDQTREYLTGEQSPRNATSGFVTSAGPGAPAPLAGMGLIPALGSFGALIATRWRRRKTVAA